ncbi:MAG: PD-(D/E)XK nuclease family protein [Bacteroidota bacterium]
MPIIYFGSALNDRSLPQPAEESLGEIRLDTKGLIRTLEAYYGLYPKEERLEYLRVEQYRQLLQNELQKQPTAFFAASFAADPLATAETLLAFRDELLAAGYPLHLGPAVSCPPRIELLHRLEQSSLNADNAFDLLPGEADRINELIAAIRPAGHPALCIWIHEPAELLPPGIVRVLNALSKVGDWLQYLPLPSGSPLDSDLRRWQQTLLQSKWSEAIERSGDNFAAPSVSISAEFLARCTPEEALRIKAIKTQWSTAAFQKNKQLVNPTKADGSLIILRAKRETHLAAYIARILRDNSSWQPGVLMARKRQTLVNALRMEGLPSLGVPSSSLARPSLQVLKLVTSFLWDPVDLRKLMEFLTLVIKPLHRTLGYRLAAALAESPGLYSEAWFMALNQFFAEELPRITERDPSLDTKQLQQQYDFWFKRTRYDKSTRAPKSELRKIFVFLINWVRQLNDLEKTDSSGLHTLAAQAERAVALIDTLAEEDLSPLEVERIVRTVYEAAPAQFQLEELGSLPVAFNPAAVFGPVDQLIWWDFVQEEPAYFFSRWYPHEIAYLASGAWSNSPNEAAVHLISPVQQNDLLRWSETRPILHCQERLVICLPDRIEGAEMLPNPLWGDLKAIFGEDLDRLLIDIDQEQVKDPLPWQMPHFEELLIRELAAPRPFIQIPEPARLRGRDAETPTSLEDFIYHPHLWILRYGVKIKASQQLSLELGSRLRGKLAHRFIERLFVDPRPISEWTKTTVYNWVQEQEVDLLRKEGGLLLEYGAEPDRVQFRRQLQRAAWALIVTLQEDDWVKANVEQILEGELEELSLKGRADLVLERTDGQRAIVDLKWRGKTRFTNLIRNREDLQLTLYARMLQDKSDQTINTAYFILSEPLLLARNQSAFKRAEAVDQEANDADVQAEILEKLLATLFWRKQLLEAGQLEIRCSATIAELEEAYQKLDYDQLLEMRDNDARYDDYRALIGVIR